MNPAFSIADITEEASGTGASPTYVNVLSGEARSNSHAEAGANGSMALRIADVQPPHFAFVLNFIY